MPSRNLDDLIPEARQAADQLLQFARDQGIDYVVTHTLRTCAEQNELYAQGRTKPGGKVTGAPGCRSWHTHGRALDLLVKDGGKIVHDGYDPRYKLLGEHSRTLGFRWGGDFGDMGHFEYHPGLTISQACPDPTDCSHISVQPSTGKDGTSTGGGKTTASVVQSDPRAFAVGLGCAMLAFAAVRYAMGLGLEYRLVQ